MKGDGAYDSEMITQYLLGALPEAETARLDELSISDDEFAGALSTAEKDLVDAYVQGELPADELEQFKRFYLASPLRREKVEFARTFQVWSESNASASAVELKSERRVKTVSSWFPGLNAPNYGWQWGFAVIVLLLMVTGGWLVFQNVRLGRQITQEQAQNDLLRQREQQLQEEIEAQRLANSKMGPAQSPDQQPKPSPVDGKSSPGQNSIVEMVLAPPLRGTNQVPTISIKPETKRVAAQLQLEPTDHSDYRVALVDPSGNRTLWRSGKLSAKGSADGKSLQLNFDAGLLTTKKIFLLRVFGTEANGAQEVIGDYSFKVEK
jgi:hypothetical protein